MNLAFFIAKRYLISKKSHNIINIISIISFVGILVSTAALIIVLSVFNGFESIIAGYFNSFNADLVIKPEQGKVFQIDAIDFQEIEKIEGVKSTSKVLEDAVLLSYDDRQFLARIKGVEQNYGTDNRFDTLIIDGRFLLQQADVNYMILGAGVAYHLGLNLAQYKSIKTYYPKRHTKSLANPLNAFNSNIIIPSAVFAVQTDYDAEYVFAPLKYTQELMTYEDEISSVEIFTNPKYDIGKIQKQLSQLLGDEFVVQNKYQQEEMLFKVMQMEKTAIYVILSFILLLAMFNIIGTLAMLILDKKDDILVLSQLGADKKLIHKIFLWEGLLLNLAGGFFGLLLGSIICLIQQYFGLIKIGGSEANYVLNVYPVEMQLVDFVSVMATVLVLGLLATILPVKRLTNRLQNQ